MVKNVPLTRAGGKTSTEKKWKQNKDIISLASSSAIWEILVACLSLVALGF